MAEKTYRFYIRQGEFELDLEGDRAFVESYLEAFFEGEAAAARAAGERAGRPAEGAARAKAGRPVPLEGAALADHMRGRKPKNHKERILAYLGYLTAAGSHEFGAAALEACFKADGARFPAAGRQYFQILKKQGLVAKGSKWGSWKLTDKGLAAAEAAGTAAPKRARKGKKAPAPAVPKKGKKKRKAVAES